MRCPRSALPILAFIVACGGGEPPPAEAPPPPPPPASPPAPERSMRLEGQLGSLDPRAFDAAFNGVLGDLQRCHTQRLDRLRWLSGDVKIFLRLGEDGGVRYGFVEDTTLGDSEAERCIMQILSDKKWPPPIGGEAEVHKSVGFDAPSNVRAPTSWSSDEITPSLVANNAKIKACRARVPGTFKVTAYVVAGAPKAAARPKGAPGAKSGKGAGKRGKADPAKPKGAGHIVAVGIAPPSKDGLESIECLVDALKEMPVPSPGSYAAKVMFAL